jgi:hypothetical protein
MAEEPSECSVSIRHVSRSSSAPILTARAKCPLRAGTIVLANLFRITQSHSGDSVRRRAT